MKSEIPQLEVITAIGDADFEDYVSQLLFTQGWSIIFRAFDGKSLEEFMKTRTQELRTVIVYTSDLPSIDVNYLQELASATVSIICLDFVPHMAHEIMQKIRGQLRIPLVQPETTASRTQAIPKITESPRKVILVTGSSGGPGKTLFTTAIGSELSQQRKVTIIDADFRSVPLDEYVPANDFSIHSYLASEKPTELPQTDSKEVVIVDVGVLPSLGEVVHDRRWMAILQNHLFDSATHLIYVAQTTKASLLQLAQFKKEFPLLMQKIAPIYICVGKGGNKEMKSAQAAFDQVVAGERSHHISELALLPAPSGVLDSILSSGNKARREIGSIATSLL